ncbi:hypothetical protein KP509_10G052700 [Ceratopteris richardii]|uniref:CYTH domain-containing protein n=1 Tax=Ceratopteris richardii TaxID=49495 RepID=A0A8T2TVY9_CERRI|nr:hypothetical protein KP509_10G052700 [Ceratopteris richardii]
MHIVQCVTYFHLSPLPLHLRTHPRTMEVEVKLRLPTAEAHQRVADLLAANHKVSHLQENVFFDGVNGELSSKKTVLRLRFYGADAHRCVVAVKGKAVIVDGISRVSEEEEEVADAATAHSCLADPQRLFILDSSLINRVAKEFQVQSFACLGGFRNVRNVFHWKDLVLELDETQYPFGTSYEIECETSDAEHARSVLEDFLHQNGIPFSYSTTSKFATFRSGKLPEIP